MWILASRRKLPPRAYRATTAVAIMAWLQVTFFFYIIVISMSLLIVEFIIYFN